MRSLALQELTRQLLEQGCECDSLIVTDVPAESALSASWEGSPFALLIAREQIDQHAGTGQHAVYVFGWWLLDTVDEGSCLQL